MSATISENSKSSFYNFESMALAAEVYWDNNSSRVYSFVRNKVDQGMVNWILPDKIDGHSISRLIEKFFESKREADSKCSPTTSFRGIDFGDERGPGIYVS